MTLSVKCHKDINLQEITMCVPYKKPFADRASIITSEVIRLSNSNENKERETNKLSSFGKKSHNCLLNRERMQKYRLFYKLNLKLIG